MSDEEVFEELRRTRIREVWKVTVLVTPLFLTMVFGLCWLGNVQGSRSTDDAVKPFAVVFGVISCVTIPHLFALYFQGQRAVFAPGSYSMAVYGDERALEVIKRTIDRVMWSSFALSVAIAATVAIMHYGEYALSWWWATFALIPLVSAFIWALRKFARHPGLQ